MIQFQKLAMKDSTLVQNNKVSDFNIGTYTFYYIFLQNESQRFPNRTITRIKKKIIVHEG